MPRPGDRLATWDQARGSIERKDGEEQMKWAIAVLYACTVSAYGPGSMEAVIANRQAGHTWANLPSTLPTVDGYAAALDCREFGSLVHLRPMGNTVWETFLVTDCARPAGTDGTAERMAKDGRLYEIDYPTAIRWGMTDARLEIEVGIAYLKGLYP